MVYLRVVVVTVGASLLSNYCRDAGVQQDALVGEGEGVGRLVEYLSGCDADWLYRACAETNTLERILKPGDSLVFLHSETVEGRMCAEALKIFYEGKGYGACVEEVKGLKYDERRFSIIGLHSLINMLVEIFEREHLSGRDVVLAATGGFKAEMAYATLAALLYGVEVYYIHERFNEVVSLPAVPLFFNPDVWLRHLEDVEWLVEKARSSEEIRKRFGDDAKYFWALLVQVEKGEDLYQLSPVGWLVYRAFGESKARKVMLAHGRGFVKAGGHTNVWKINAEILPLKEIPDEDARRLLRRLLSVGGVKEIRLGRFGISKVAETYVKHQETKGVLVRYKLYSRGYGYQELEVVTESPEDAKTLEDFIGSKAYP
ncbi:MAG: putative CRISPR-associated protein [Candidatus Jordarchaeales archaeon]